MYGIVTQRVVRKYMARSGAKRYTKSKNRLQYMLDNSVPVRMKPGIVELRIIKNNFEPAEYRFYGGWYFTIVNEELKTVYQNNNKWFCKHAH